MDNSKEDIDSWEGSASQPVVQLKTSSDYSSDLGLQRNFGIRYVINGELLRWQVRICRRIGVEGEILSPLKRHF